MTQLFAREYFQPQRGQAIAEALITLALLLLVLTAVSWLGRYQDIALQASHASRYAAFATARADTNGLQSIWHDYFGGRFHRWSDRQGQLLLQSESQLAVQIDRGGVLAALAQPGQTARNAQELREQWSVADEGIVDAGISVGFLSGDSRTSDAGLFASGLRDFDAAYPKLTRHTSILSGAGHASGAAHAQQRVSESTLAWSDASDHSYRLAEQIQTVMNPVDAGWGRAEPDKDWLDAWSDVVPDHHRSYGEQP